MNKEKDNPQVVAPPPLIYLSGALAGVIIHWFYPRSFLPESVSMIAGTFFSVFGLAIIAQIFWQMHKAKTNIEPWRPTTKILDSGFYAVSRNPIYVAMILVYSGVGSFVNSLWVLAFLPFVLAVVHYGVILREEIYLEKKFGQVYSDYQSKVRRWL